MGTLRIEDFNSMQLDVLREIGNIGGGNAATALATLVSDSIQMSVPRLDIMDIDEATHSLGGPENAVIGISFEMSDDVNGLIMFLLETTFFKKLVKSLLGMDIDPNKPLNREENEMEISLLSEVGNILAGSYLKALSQLTGLTINISTPDLCFDMAGAIMSLPATAFGVQGDKALMIQEDFIYGGESINSHLIMVPDEESFNTIFGRLGVL